MGKSETSPELIELARNLDLYARRHRIIFALDVGEFEKALLYCRGAMADCQRDLLSDATRTERERHERNLSSLRQFESRLTEAAIDAGAAAHNWISA